MSDRSVGGAFHVLCAALLLLACLTLYSNTLEVPFVFDDVSNIEQNDLVRVAKLDVGSLLKVGFGSSDPRPVSYMSFALNYYFDEYEVRGYHIVNIFIHWLSGILVYGLVADLFRRQRALRGDAVLPGHRLSDFLPALLAAGIFIAHPIQTQAVTYIVQRMSSMAAMFYLLALFLYLCGRDRAGAKRVSFWVGSVVCWFLAVGSKQTAVTLPLLIFLYEWYFLQNLSFDWLKRQLPILAAVALSMACFAGLFLVSHPDGAFDYRLRDFEIMERLLTQSRVLVRYLSLLVFPIPSRLNLTHNVPVSHSMLDPLSTLYSTLTLLALFVISIRTARSQRVLSFCILWFFGNLAIESTFVSLEMMFEHRLYLPMLAFSVLVADGFRLAFSRYGTPAAVISVALVVALGIGTYERNKVWRDPITLWSDVISKSPEDFRAYNSLGSAYRDVGKLDAAITLLRRSAELNETYYPTRINLAGIALDQGNRGEAIRQLRAALVVDPDPHFAESHFLLSTLLAHEKEWSGAREHAEEALRLRPDHFKLMMNLALILAKDPDRNTADLRRAVRLATRADAATQHSLPQMLSSLATVYAAAGQFSEAAAVVVELLEIDLATGSVNTDRLRARLKAYERSGHRGSGTRSMVTPKSSTDPQHSTPDLDLAR